MTLKKFERLLKRIDPQLRLRRRGRTDTVGIYAGTKYICRISKGEFNLNGYRLVGKDDHGNPFSRIHKRGRETAVNLLRNYRWITNHKQRSMLIWGIEYPDEEIKGLTGKSQYD